MMRSTLLTAALAGIALLLAQACGIPGAVICHKLVYHGVDLPHGLLVWCVSSLGSALRLEAFHGRHFICVVNIYPGRLFNAEQRNGVHGVATCYRSGMLHCPALWLADALAGFGLWRDHVSVAGLLGWAGATWTRRRIYGSLHFLRIYH